MYKIKSLLFLLLVITVSTVSCQSTNEDKDDFNMTALELKQAMAEDSNLVILDVRTPQELVGQHGQIEGVINIPVQVLNQRINEMEKYKDKNVAVICRSGNRSVMATKMMQAKGFKAKNVLGGMKAYNKL
jgi:rhodanese-related sulfurtransferase